MGDYKDFNDYEVMYLVEENDENAKDVLYEKYRPLIVSIASQYQKEAKEYGIELDDLVQEGFIGLYSASKNYNSKMNVKFYTYALVSIRSKILNCLNTKNTYKHIYLNQSISLFQPLADFNQFTLMDALEDKNAVIPHFLVEESEFEDNIKTYLYSLDFPHSLVFELKINGFRNVDISKLLDFSTKKVSNILFSIRKDFQRYLVNH